MSERIKFVGATVFDGQDLFEDHSVLVENGTIIAVCPSDEPVTADQSIALAGGLLAPGFLDLQINGGGGILFNDRPTPDGITAIAATHRKFGVCGFLPTLITDEAGKMQSAADAVRRSIANNDSACIGLHLEGPFIAASRKGAHDLNLIREITPADVDFLLSLGVDTLLVTLAPEKVPTELIRRMTDNGIHVSLGHSEATYDQVSRSVDAGATLVTHLFNAMSPLSQREPGLVGAALDLGDLWCGIIADGHHVKSPALRLALRAKSGPGRLFFVSDAMPTVGQSGDSFKLGGRFVTRNNGRLELADGTLAGADLSLDRALKFGISELRLHRLEALRMASLYPASALRLDRRYGRIAKGYRANLVHLDDDNSIRGVWIGGAGGDL